MRWEAGQASADSTWGKSLVYMGEAFLGVILHGVSPSFTWGKRLWALLKALGALFGRSWTLLKALGALFGRSWSALGRS